MKCIGESVGFNFLQKKTGNLSYGLVVIELYKKNIGPRAFWVKNADIFSFCKKSA